MWNERNFIKRNSLLLKSIFLNRYSSTRSKILTTLGNYISQCFRKVLCCVKENQNSSLVPTHLADLPRTAVQLNREQCTRWDYRTISTFPFLKLYAPACQKLHIVFKRITRELLKLKHLTFVNTSQDSTPGVSLKT